jgi:hypothetical protein
MTKVSPEKSREATRRRGDTAKEAKHPVPSTGREPSPRLRVAPSPRRFPRPLRTSPDFSRLRMMKRVIPIFPLPIVQFPGALTPLHIFEPRYRQMLKDVMGGDRIFGIIYRSNETTSESERLPAGCIG